MAGDDMKRLGFVSVRLFSASAAVVIAAALSACSSSPRVSQPPPGTLPAGTAKVVINAKALADTTVVECTPVGSLTKIATGDPAAGVTALVSNANRLTARSVTISNLGGFSGSYMEGLAGKADVTMVDQTYLIRGTAEGFDSDNPNLRATYSFAVTVAC
jgi:ipoprotein LpqH